MGKLRLRKGKQLWLMNMPRVSNNAHIAAESPVLTPLLFRVFLYPSWNCITVYTLCGSSTGLWFVSSAAPLEAPHRATSPAFDANSCTFLIIFWALLNARGSAARQLGNL